ncbi:MAG: HIT family protein, partial [Candidatus Shapirobacteria bacterium]
MSSSSPKPKSESCTFCRIASGQLSAHKIWEDANHLAFLDIFPNCLGQTVLITKKHFSSYFADLPARDLSNFILASKKVVKILDAAFADVSRTGLVFEGFGVNHLHAKLYPLHGTGDLRQWQAIESANHNVPKKYFAQYEGYIASYSFARVPDEELSQTASMIV